MATASLLVVDDEVDFSNAIAERMRSRGYEVETADRGAEALEKIKKKQFDAILLDLTMPEMDGMETMKRMLAYDDTLQIIILTGYGSVQKGVDAIKAGAADFLEKPADIDALVGKVDVAHQTREALFQKELEKKVSDLMKRKPW